VKSAFNKTPKVTHQIAPCLWFADRAEEAAEFYVSVFKNSKILNKSYYTSEGFEFHGRKEGSLMTVEFQINGLTFTGLNAGPMFKFTEAISFQIPCDTQDEIDYYWNNLTKDGGEEGPCGWLKDKFGVSWQVIPAILPKLLSDPARAARVTSAYLKMKKFELDKLLNA
jgi:predicted 3-demethylubiquinone-9 3-methyltransferase (glyoxalase superfamily)